MPSDVLIKIRTALEGGGIDAAKRSLGGLETSSNKASAAGTDLGVNYARVGRQIATGISIRTAALGAFIKKGIDTADQLNVVSKRVGISVESLSRLKFAANQTETNFETLTRGLQRLNINIGKTGIEGAELQPVLLGLADTVKNSASAADQAAIANEAFGRGIGAELLPFLKEGSAGIEKLTGSEADFAEISTASAQAADAFNDSLSKLGTRVSTLAVDIGGPLVSSINQLFDALGRVSEIEAAKDANQEFRESAKGIADEIAEIDAQLAGGVPASEGIIRRRDALELLRKQLIETRKAELGSASGAPEIFGPPKPSDGAAQAAVEEITKIKEAKTEAEKEITEVAKQGASQRVSAAREVASAEMQAASEAESAAEAQREAVESVSTSLRDQIVSTNAEREALALGGAEGARYATIQREIASAVAATGSVTAPQIAQIRELADAQQSVRNADFSESLQQQTAAIQAQSGAFNEGVVEAKRYEVVLREIARATEAGVEQTAQFFQEVQALATAESQVVARDEGARQAKEFEDQARQASETAQQEFDRQSEVISQSLTDALLRGFENGKSLAENFKDTLVNLFKTLVLRPVIEFLVKPVAQIAQQVIGSALQGILGLGAQALGVGGGGGGALSSLFGAGLSAFGGGGGGSPGSPGADLVNQTLQTGFSSLLTGTETVTAAINQLGFQAGLTGGPSGQAGLLGAQSASSLLGVIGGGAAIAGLSFGVGSLLGPLTGSALEGAGAGLGAGAATGAAVGSVIPVIGTVIGAIIGALAGGAGGGLSFSTPPRGFQSADFSSGSLKIRKSGKKGFDAAELDEPINQLVGAIQDVNDRLNLDLVKKRIKFFIGFQQGPKGAAFRANVGGADKDFKSLAEAQGAIFKEEVLFALPKKERTKFQKKVLERAFSPENDLFAEQLKSIEKDLATRKKFKEFTKQVEFDPRTEKIKELRSEIKELNIAFARLKGEAKELGLNTKRAEEALKKTRRRTKDQILGIQIEGEAEKVSVQQQAFQLAGEEVPAELQEAGVVLQFKALGIKFRELGLDTQVLDRLLGKALENLKENIAVASQQAKLSAQAQAFQLAGRQVPIELQRSGLQLQFRELGEQFRELGLDSTILTELLSQALANLDRAQEAARVDVQAQAFQLAGQEVPVELQRAGIQIQFAELGRQFQELGLDATILTQLLAQALANLDSGITAQRDQLATLSTAFQAAGRQVPIAVQQDLLILQFRELSESFAELGLDAGTSAQLLAEALLNLQTTQQQARLQAQSQAFQLAGRQTPLEVQRQLLILQFRQLEQAFADLGADASILAPLLSEALAGLETEIQSARQSALERAFQLAGEEIPKEIQIAGITAEFTELGTLFQELGLDSSILGGLLQQAIENINSAGEDLRSGGFIGFIDELGRITQTNPNELDISANDPSFDVPAFATGTRNRVVTKPELFLAGERGPESVNVVPLTGGRGGMQGDVNINLNGPAIFDSITQNKFTREVGRQLRSRAGRFG